MFVFHLYFTVLHNAEFIHPFAPFGLEEGKAKSCFGGVEISDGRVTRFSFSVNLI